MNKVACVNIRVCLEMTVLTALEMYLQVHYMGDLLECGQALKFDSRPKPSILSGI
jgi:hypothetical protein